jgi:hypothetical protein
MKEPRGRLLDGMGNGPTNLRASSSPLVVDSVLLDSPLRSKS